MTLSNLRRALEAVPSLRRVQIGKQDADAVWALRSIVSSVTQEVTA